MGGGRGVFEIGGGGRHVIAVVVGFDVNLPVGSAGLLVVLFALARLIAPNLGEFAHASFGAVGEDGVHGFACVACAEVVDIDISYDHAVLA